MKKTLWIACIMFIWNALASAAVIPLQGDADVYDPYGGVIFSTPVNGTWDQGANTMEVTPFMFFGLQMGSTFELLGEGTHTRPTPYGPISITVSPGQLGSFVTVTWGANTFHTFMVWDVVTIAGVTSLVPVDTDGDGVPGRQLTDGPFPGFTLSYDFTRPEAQPPGIEVSILGANSGVCSELGGRPFSLSANIVLLGDTSLNTIEWRLDGEVIGTEATVNPLIPAGTHTIEVVVTNTTGQTDSASSAVSVYDWTQPEVNVAFVDARTGAEITSIQGSRVQFVKPVLYAEDSCDPEPAVTAVASPVHEVSDSTVLKVQGNTGGIDIPATGIEVRITATDDAGNSRTGSFVLPVE